MSIKVGINGFGRIGRCVHRSACIRAIASNGCHPNQHARPTKPLGVASPVPRRRFGHAELPESPRNVPTTHESLLPPPPPRSRRRARASATGGRAARARTRRLDRRYLSSSSQPGHARAPALPEHRDRRCQRPVHHDRLHEVHVQVRHRARPLPGLGRLRGGQAHRRRQGHQGSFRAKDTSSLYHRCVCSQWRLVLLCCSTRSMRPSVLDPERPLPPAHDGACDVSRLGCGISVRGRGWGVRDARPMPRAHSHNSLSLSPSRSTRHTRGSVSCRGRRRRA